MTTMHSTSFILAASILSLLAGCAVDSSSQAIDGPSDESTSAIVTLPRRDGFPVDARAKLTGYRLVIKPIAGSCTSPTSVDDTNSWVATNVTAQIRQGCDYSIGVELGNLDTTGYRLKDTYFTNVNANGMAKILRASEFLDKPTLSLGLQLAITEAGRAAGFSGGVVLPSRQTDLSIEVSVDAGATPNSCQSGDTSEGSLSDQSEAKKLCPTWCSHKKAEWNGQWTTRTNGTSVCGCVCPQADAGSSAQCKDSDTQCAAWAARGECKANPDYMLPNCCASCAASDCTRDVRPPSAPQYTCKQQADWKKCNESWMKGYCNISCGRCASNNQARQSP